MKRFEFNKLIRDKLPSRMQEEKVSVYSTPLSPDEYSLQLKNKLIEEVNEVLEADSREELTVELADVLEVIHSLAKVYGIGFERIEEERLKKLQANGTFAPEHYIHYIEVEESNKRVIEYLLNKKRAYVYP